MKKSIIGLLFIILSFSCRAQNVVKDENGNYVVVKSSVSSQFVKKPIINTGHTYTVNNIVYPIYESVNGKFYILRTSAKTGKLYKQYLKI